MFKTLFFLIAFISPCFSLSLDRVILATDDNPLYIEFWPIVAPIWEKMGFKPTLALIADKECPIDTSLGDVIRFDPIPDVPVSLQAQAIRLLLPALFPEDGCILSDIDMIPILHEYFIQGASTCPDSAFLVYRDAYNLVTYPMCYVAGKGQVFKELFEVHSEAEIPVILRKWAQKGYGWNTDEIILYQTVNEWEKQGGHVIRLGHSVSRRLDRANWNVDFRTLNITRYIDCHCPRPYSAYKKSIDQVVEQVIYRLDH